MPIERDDLADLPPEDFVAARDELARRLREEGEKAEATEVKKLRKPTVSQWIADQVRRHHPDVVDTLRTASSAVAEAQATAITSGDRTALRDTTAKRRDAVHAVGHAIDQVIARSGRPAHHRDEVLAAIESAVTADVSSGTFGVPDDLRIPQARRRKRGAPRDRLAERRTARAAAAIEAAEDRVRRAREELEQAETALAATVERFRRPGPDR